MKKAAKDLDDVALMILNQIPDEFMGFRTLLLVALRLGHLP